MTDQTPDDAAVEEATMAMAARVFDAARRGDVEAMAASSTRACRRIFATTRATAC
jgi:hypothetical protein